MKKEKKSQDLEVNRRDFLKTVPITGAAASAFPMISTAFGQGEKMRVGLVGCGGRGTGAVMNILGVPTDVIYPPPLNGYHTENPKPGAKRSVIDVEVVALADAFSNRLEDCRNQLRKVGTEIPQSHCFLGIDGYKKLVELDDVDYVILATPPHFRPMELRACVEAGKHAFMEKPVAVDSPGVNSILESGEIAKEKGLGIVAGTQRRHQADIVETVKRLHDGAIGEIFQARAYFNIGEIWMIPREPGWTDMEWHLRNWNYFTWLSGDILVEQHIHMIDAVNWVMGSHPVRAYGMGGRLARPGTEYGHIYDHFAIEYEYPNGALFFSQNRQIEGCTNRISLSVRGSEGTSNCENWIKGKTDWKYEGSFRNPYEQEHRNLIESIRSGNPLNEARTVAESTLTAIMGRESAYSGQEIGWEAALASKRVYKPVNYSFGSIPFPEVAKPKTYEFY